jgi:hypothetical protein
MMLNIFERKHGCEDALMTIVHTAARVSCTCMQAARSLHVAAVQPMVWPEVVLCVMVGLLLSPHATPVCA